LTELGNHEKADNTLKILVESLSSDLPLKSKLSIDDNEDAWKFLQEIMTKNKIIVSNMS
jgi:hypothetical protein